MPMKSVLDSFSGLRLRHQHSQLIASGHVIEHIARKQGSNENACREFELSIKKIIRGLGAPSRSSRIGFFSVFAVIPEVFDPPAFNLDWCIQVIKNELEAYGKEDMADVCRGQVLAYGALVFSNRFYDATNDQVSMILDKILAVRDKKSYLKIAVHMILVELLKSINQDAFQKCVWNKLRNQVIHLDKIHKPLQFYHLLLVLSEQFPRIVNSEIMTTLVGAPSLFHNDTLQMISKAMVGIEKYKLIETVMYRDLLDMIVSNADWLKIFWTNVLLAASSGSESKIKMAFMLFMYIIKELQDKNKIKLLLKERFVILLVSDFYDHLNEPRLAAIAALSKEASIKGALTQITLRILVEKFAFYPGNFKFILGSGKTLAHALVNNFEEENVIYFGNLFHKILINQSMKVLLKKKSRSVLRPWKDTQKKQALICLTRLLNHSAVDQNVDWKVMILKVVCDFAFFTQNPTVSSLERAAQTCFFSALDKNLQRLDDQKALFKQLVSYIHIRLIDKNFSRILRTNEFMQGWKTIVDAIAMIDSTIESDNSSKLAKTIFEVMFYLLAFMLIRDAETAVTLIKDLRLTYNKMHAAESALKFSTRFDDPAPGELKWIDVLVDLILSMLSSESHLQRTVISKSFIYLCPHLTPSNINQLLKVLNPSETKIIVKPDEVNSDSDDSSSDSDDDSGNSDDESSDSERENHQDMEVSTDEEIEDVDAGMPEDEKDLELLRANVYEALNSVKSEGTINIDDMSEEEGRRLDESLSQAFRKMKQFTKKTLAAEEKQLNVFRARVLDLLEVYLRVKPDLEVVFEIMIAVFMLLENLINNGTNLELQNRIRSFIKKLTSVKKFSVKAKLDTEQLVELLQKIITKNERSTAVYINMKEQIVDCSHFILKLSLKQNKCFRKIRPAVLNIYVSAFTNFLTKRNTIIPVGLFHKAATLPWAGLFKLAETALTWLSRKDSTRRSHQLKNTAIFLDKVFTNGRLLTPDIVQSHQLLIDMLVHGVFTNIDSYQNQPLKVRKRYVHVAQQMKKYQLGNSHTKDITIMSLKRRLLKRPLEESDESEDRLKPDVFDEEGKENIISKKEKEEVEKMAKQKSPPSKKSVDVKKKFEKRKYQEAMQEKKKSKLRRVQSSSEGLKEGVFVFNDPTANLPFVHGEVVDSDEYDDYYCYDYEEDDKEDIED